MSLKYTYIFFLTTLSSYVYSQDVYNTAPVFIPNSIEVHIGNLNNFGFIQNNGTIEVTGDWKNGNVYQGLGTVSLSGSNQDIDNNGQSIENLLIDGGSVKILEGDLTINGSFELASGIVSVNDGSTLLIAKGAKIEGGSASSFVDGPLTVEGTGYHFFPVGVDNNYYPIVLNEVRGLDPVLKVTAFENLPDVETERSIELNKKYYWSQELVSGSYLGSTATIDHDDITFISANDLGDIFKVEDVLTRKIIAFGVVPPEPIQPGYLSTSLSPNAQNAENRLIKFFGTEASETNFSLRVFNRWGNIMFESSSLSAMITDGWDGKYNGQYLPAGAYPYKLSYIDNEGREGNKTGFITIIY